MFAWSFRQWRIKWRDRHLCHVTGSDHEVTTCTHSRVVGLRLEGNNRVITEVAPSQQLRYITVLDSSH